MYKVEHEFSFDMQHNDNAVKFIGKLLFENKRLNELGSLHTDEDMDSFGVALNRAISIPEYWTLEIMAKTLYDNIKPIFVNLAGIKLSIEQAPYRTAEYNSADEFNIDEIVELPNIVG